MTFESAAYVARYVMKKVTGDAAEAHYTTVNVETGEDFSRPHFHSCLFNCFFPDRKRIPGGNSGSPALS